MKLKIIFAILSMALFIVSCNDSDDPVAPFENELEGLAKIKEMSNDTHIIELYSPSGTLTQGFNEVSVRIKNKSTGEFEKNAEISWLPMMQMMSMSHSCPKSEIKKVSANGTLYRGYLVFQMAQNDMEFWNLTMDYSINGTDYEAVSDLDVPVSSKQIVTTFTGSDNEKYILAYAEPKNPKVAVNDCVIGVWKMQDMMNFPVVNNYTVKIDPRMPSMGNHTSPNNEAAKQSSSGGLYYGKLSLTMTGFWRINLQLLDENGNVLKGEEVTDSNPESSLFFEIEF
ncbi:MAG: hypothetical protein LBE36_03715 [Flavobacteriaceae bacterium]|jgi:hypothetical protein|nr:hypothetical protein [Flavobacteriaceae bacterium]